MEQRDIKNRLQVTGVQVAGKIQVAVTGENKIQLQVTGFMLQGIQVPVSSSQRLSNCLHATPAKGSQFGT